MNDHKLLPDDPRLTTYAFGELEASDRAAVEPALRDDPAARATVEAIRTMGAQLESALAAEPAPAACEETSLAHAAIIPGRDLRKLDGGPMWSGKLVPFPRFYLVAGGLAAACVAIMVTLRQPSLPEPAVAKKIVRSVPPAPPAAAPALTDAAALPSAASPFLRRPGDLSLLGQAKNSEEQTRKVRAVAFGPGSTPVGQLTLGNSISASNPPTPAIDRVASVTLAALGQESASRTLAHSADEKLVVTTQTAAAAIARTGARGEAPAQRITVVGGAGSVSGSSPFLPPSTGTLTLSSNIASPTGTLALSSGTGVVNSGTLTYGGGALGMGFLSASTVSRGIKWREAERTDEFDRGRTLAPREAGNTESYAYARDNDFLGVAQNPLSTFSIDADTASYANVRRFLQNRQRPPRDAVRIEELLNYFPYRYAPPKGEAPFAAALEVAEAPWAPTHRLVRIGLKGREVTTAARPVANLVFLLDVSGSMNAPNRLPLVKESMRLLVGQLRPDDRVAIVTYAGASGLALPSTPVAQAHEILDALDRLTPGGSTNGAMGIQLAYDIAKANFVTGGANRVILCTDGDFNVGVTSEGELVRLIEEKAKSGVFLTVLGFGMGNLKDSTLEKLADHGNGHYGYIDSRREAQKLLVEQVNGTLVTIAKDVKIQVEFNPAKVASYRLIGYENRLLKKEDFNNDKVDAGEIGAGHTVTALYEIVPMGTALQPNPETPPVDELRYQAAKAAPAKAETTNSSELLVVKIRYKEPAGDVSRKLEFPLTDSGGKFAAASADFKFVAAVASFGMILRDSPHRGTATPADVIAWTEAGNSDDAGGYRSEFIGLAREAAKLGR